MSICVDHNKLVRDKIPNIIEAAGDQCVYETLSDSDYIRKLDEKLQEEVSEYKEDKSLAELADVQEVILAILDAKGVTFAEFEDLRKRKKDLRGGFENKVFLKSTTRISSKLHGAEYEEFRNKELASNTL